MAHTASLTLDMREWGTIVWQDFSVFSNIFAFSYCTEKTCGFFMTYSYRCCWCKTNLWLKGNLGVFLCRKRLRDRKKHPVVSYKHRQTAFAFHLEGYPPILRHSHCICYFQMCEYTGDWKAVQWSMAGFMKKAHWWHVLRWNTRNAKVKMVYRPTGCYQCDDVIVSLLDIQPILKSYIFWKVFSIGFVF